MGESSSDLIHLQPYIHQVGGHSSMLCLDEVTVCKPVVPRELEFYETIPEPLKKFVPQFHGVIEVNVVEDVKGYVKFIAKPPALYKPHITNSRRTLRLRRSGSIEVEGEQSDLFFGDPDDKSSILNHPTALNPWVFKCHQNQVKQLIEQMDSGKTSKFIILENLTMKFLYPCILDLKMGTRQYGDSDSLSKKQSKMYKVVSTTSGKLGVRIGGMQVYQVSTKRYICRNKFYGRSLSVGGFHQALKEFFHNGITFRSDVLPPLIRRLEELVRILSCQDAVRFYTTSLLLLYEGASANSSTTYDFDISKVENMVNSDVSKKEVVPCISCSKAKPESASTEDTSLSKHSAVVVKQSSFEGNLKRSINSAIKKIDTGSNHTSGSSSPHLKLSPSPSVVGDIKKCSSAERLTDIPDESIDEYFSQVLNRNFLSRRRSSSATRADEAKLSGSSSFSNTPLDSPRPVEPLVDIRIIDFAHSTHKGLGGPVTYSGPDKGFLYGLENMITCLKTIQRDNG